MLQGKWMRLAGLKLWQSLQLAELKLRQSLQLAA